MIMATIGMDGIIPWDPAMQLGDGYDIDKFQSVSSALSEVNIVRTGPEGVAITVDFQSHIIRTKEDLDTQIDVSMSLSSSITPLFSLAESSAYLKSIKCNETSMTTIIRCTITSSSREILSTPKLSEGALKCLKKSLFEPRDFEKFYGRYGQYCVWGRISLSTLSATCIHTAKSKEKLDKFTLEIGGSYNLVGLDAISKYIKKAQSSKIETKISVQMTGCSTAGIGNYISASEFERVLKGFMDNHRPVPQLAILKHYSNLYAKITRPSERPLLPKDISNAYQTCLSLQVISRTCKMIKAAEVLPKLAAETKTLSGIRPSMIGWESDLQAVQGHLTALKADLEKVPVMQTLYQQAQTAATNIELRKWYKGTAIASVAGVTDKCASHPLANEIELKPYNLKKGAWSLRSGDRVIIGFRVLSLQNESSNGSWRLNKGWIGGNLLEVEFSPAFLQDCKWTVEVWSVHRDYFTQKDE